ncbi:60S ribosomal protein L18a-like protein [Glycine soja]|uniref:60S ribosomal protein L18a-like protein n=1 Tax=Glycine soja TaxID=3848 RepID=A0A445I8J1_GLYSO|nr:60S ribosomal protein L18a-like protein [Glycine soja]
MIPKVSPMSEDEKNREIGIATDNPYYVTFQGVANHFPPQHQHPQSPSANYYQRQGYHVVPVVIVIFYDDINDCNFIYIARFIIGWFIGGVPWYVGTFILMFVQMDCREVPGLIACTVASFVTVIVVALGITQGDLGKLTSF